MIEKVENISFDVSFWPIIAYRYRFWDLGFVPNSAVPCMHSTYHPYRAICCVVISRSLPASLGCSCHIGQCRFQSARLPCAAPF